MAGNGAVAAAALPPGIQSRLSTMLILVFAYGGFEAALMPLAEAKDPQRDAPVALFVKVT